MKRFWIVLVAVVVLALIVALPAAGKGKPDKPPKEPEPEPVLVCDFHEDGVLWIIEEDGSTWQWIGDGHVRCKLRAEPFDSFTLVMETADGAKTVLHPYIAVTDVYPHSGNWCYMHDPIGKYSADGAGVFTRLDVNPIDPNPVIHKVFRFVTSDRKGRTVDSTFAWKQIRLK